MGAPCAEDACRRDVEHCGGGRPFGGEPREPVGGEPLGCETLGGEPFRGEDARPPSTGGL